MRERLKGTTSPDKWTRSKTIHFYQRIMTLPTPDGYGIEDLQPSEWIELATSLIEDWEDVNKK